MKRLFKLYICCLLPLSTLPLTLAGADPEQHIAREYIEWADIYIPGANKSDKPHILLIGNSITRGYHPEVSQILEPRAYVARLSTSKSLGDPAYLEEVTNVLKNTRFDVIHFNNGLHGMEYTDGEYDRAFDSLLRLFDEYAPGARIIWANCTPIYTDDTATQLQPDSRRGTIRNRIAHAHVAPLGIEINPLDSVMIGHPEYFLGGDGVHPQPVGYSALAHKVVEVLERYLPADK